MITENLQIQYRNEETPNTYINQTLMRSMAAYGSRYK